MALRLNGSRSKCFFFHDAVLGGIREIIVSRDYVLFTSPGRSHVVTVWGLIRANPRKGR